MNKKGMDISLNFIILAVLALIALIVIALFFTGGLTNLFRQTEEVGSISAQKMALYKSECELYCTLGDYTAWENPEFQEEELKDVKCSDSRFELSKTWTDTDSDGQNDKCS